MKNSIQSVAKIVCADIKDDCKLLQENAPYSVTYNLPNQKIAGVCISNQVNAVSYLKKQKHNQRELSDNIILRKESKYNLTMEENDKNIINKDDLPKSNLSEPLVNLEVIKNMLTHAGLAQYDPEVITHLADCADFFTTSIIEKATTLMKHANRTRIDKKDITLAIDFINKEKPKRLSQKELMELARKHNKTELPNIESRGLPLPNNGIVLKEANYKMKSPYSNLTKYQMNYPLMDLMNRQNQMIALSRHRGGLTTVLRSPLGNVPGQVNRTPQRIVVKPKIPTPNSNIGISQNKIEERAFQFYDLQKK